MSTETKTKTRTTKTSKQVVDEVATTVEKPVVKNIDLNQMIVVRNGFHGRLVYKSSRTKERFVWPDFGDEQIMELLELRNAKNAYKKYFINNWFMFDDEFAWVIDYLGMSRYYKNALKVDDFDDVFSKSPAEIEKIVSKLSEGQKTSLSYRARQLIADHEIDSNKAIAALEKSLGIELVER